MSKSAARNEPAVYPEYGVRKEVICNFFSPPMPSSTFHDRVNQGIIIPLKSMRGFYKLNDSLRRLGLREVPELPRKIAPRTTEEIIRLAFHMIDPEVFPPPAWLMAEDAVDKRVAGDRRVAAGLSNGTDFPGHRFQAFGEVVFPRSRDQQPFLGPGHAPSSLRYAGQADVEEFHVLGGLDFRGFDLAEAEEE